MPPEFVDSPVPLIPIFITNGYYRGDAIHTAENYGLVLWNAEQISGDIAKYFGLSVFIKDSKIAEYKLREYLNSL